MDHHQQKLSRPAYLVSALSFIPIVGILFGMIAIVWGCTTSKSGGKKLIVIGTVGIVVNFILVAGPLFLAAGLYCDSRHPTSNGVYNESKQDIGIGEITVLMQSIEFYKITNGHYPENLQTLLEAQSKKSIIFVFDSSYGNGMERYFYYQVVDPDHYYLLGLGKDGLPFTKDDILPDISLGPNSRVGYIVKATSERGS